MKIIAKLFLALFLLNSLPAVEAQSMYADAVNYRAAEFMDSGILRSNENGTLIKLVQGLKIANSTDEAIGAFTRDALNSYPGYSLIDTIATPIPKRKDQCGQFI